MKILLALSAASLVAACASAPEQYAQNDCKVAPVVTAGPAAQGRVTSLDQRYAEMQLATSDYRLRSLAQNPSRATNSLEQGLDDCARK